MIELMQLTPSSMVDTIHPMVQGAYYNFFTNAYFISLWSIFAVFSTIFMYILVYGGYELTIYIFYWISQDEIDEEEREFYAKLEKKWRNDWRKKSGGGD